MAPNNAIPRSSLSPSFAIPIFLLLTLLFITNLHTSLASSTNASSSTNSLKIYKSYIKKACNSTTYPKVCYKSLHNYAKKIKENPLRLSTLSLSISLKAAKDAISTISKLSKLKGLTRIEKEVIEDCHENAENTVDELNRSLSAMKKLGGSTSDKATKKIMDDIKTWVSAAITDEDTCSDEFNEFKVRTSVKKPIRISIANLARLTSNSLSLITDLSK